MNSIVCGQCDKIFCSKANRLRHEINIHGIRQKNTQHQDKDAHGLPETLGLPRMQGLPGLHSMLGLPGLPRMLRTAKTA